MEYQMENKNESQYEIKQSTPSSSCEVRKDFSVLLKKIEKQRQSCSYHKMMEKNYKQSCAQNYILKKNILPSSLATPFAKSRILKLNISKMKSGKLLELSKNQDQYEEFKKKVNTVHASTMKNDQSVEKLKKGQKWKLVLTEEQKNQLYFGKELKMGKQLRIKYMGHNQPIQPIKRKLRKKKNSYVSELFDGKKKQGNAYRKKSKCKFLKLPERQIKMI